MFEECEEREARGCLTRLQLEHLFQLLFLGCKRPLLTFFSPLTKNLPAAPDVFLIHFWQTKKRSVTVRRTPKASRWLSVGLAGVAVQELCVLAIFPLLPVLGCSCTSRAGLSALPRRAPSLTWGLSLIVPSSQ